MNHWTSKEDKFLLEWYGRVPNTKIAKQLPGRSAEAVRARVHRLRKKGWKFYNNELERNSE